MSFFYHGKFYVADKHIPWNYQQSPSWNIERAKLYVDRMRELNKQNYSPFDSSNLEIIQDINFEMARKFEKRVFL